MKLFYIVLLLFLFACSSQENEKLLFEQLSSNKTNINFRNTLKETPEFNVMNYTYFYNGGGVAIGDVNNDGLPDIYFTGNLVASHLYLNQGDWKFTEVAEKAGVKAEGLWNTGVTMADVNGDGWLDIYVCRSAAVNPFLRQNLLYINDRKSGNEVSFTEHAGTFLLNDDGYSTQAAFFDYDRDGDLDMYLLNHSVPEFADFNRTTGLLKNRESPYYGDKLYRNEEIGFTNVTKEAGIVGNVLGFGLGVSISDFNSDGWPDIYVSNDFNEEDYLYINQQNGSFSQSLTSSMDQVSLFSMGSDASDINNDGLTDIVTLDMLPEDNFRNKMAFGPDNYDKYRMLLDLGFYPQSMRNMLQLNQGNGTFQEVGQLSGISASDWSWSALIADYDLDGFQDLFVTNGYLRDYTNMDFLSYSVDMKIRIDSSGEEVNIEEILKEMPEIAVPNKLYKNLNGIRFQDVSEESGFRNIELSNGAAYGDLDNDGDLDLVINNVNLTASVYRNLAMEKNKGSFLKVILQSDTGVTVGARVIVHCDGSLFQRELYTTRGYQSSVEPVLHFGLDGHTRADSIVVYWPSGLTEIFEDPVEISNTITIVEGTGSARVPRENPVATYFSENIDLFQFSHRENPFNDFKVQSLLPCFYSRQGPPLAVADLNGDNLDDLVIGGALNQAAQVYLSDPTGWRLTQSNQLMADSIYEDVDLELADLDGDSDLDLLVASGGNHSEDPDDYPVRLYLNDGRGNFAGTDRGLPSIMLTVVKIHDIDQDGDEDIFLGSGYLPWKYPDAGENMILLNQGRGEFKKSTEIPFAHQMVTDAAFSDLDKNGKIELVVAGEWEPLRIYTYDSGGWSLAAESSTTGWWSALNVADLDSDGKEEIIAGNFGLNSGFKASPAEPIKLFVDDFDANGTVDPILTQYNKGKSYPFVSRDDLLGQLPHLKKNFPDYKSYAATDTEELLGIMGGNPEVKSVTVLESQIFTWAGDSLIATPLPGEVQVAPVYDVTAMDIDSDQDLDLIFTGNHIYQRVKTGPITANHGVVLENLGNLQFKKVSQTDSGLLLRGDVRSTASLKRDDQTLLLFGVNDSSLRTYQLNLSAPVQ